MRSWTASEHSSFGVKTKKWSTTKTYFFPPKKFNCANFWRMTFYIRFRNKDIIQIERFSRSCEKQTRNSAHRNVLNSATFWRHSNLQLGWGWIPLLCSYALLNCSCNVNLSFLSLGAPRRRLLPLHRLQWRERVRSVNLAGNTHSGKTKQAGKKVITLYELHRTLPCSYYHCLETGFYIFFALFEKDLN